MRDYHVVSEMVELKVVQDKTTFAIINKYMRAKLCREISFELVDDDKIIYRNTYRVCEEFFPDDFANTPEELKEKIEELMRTLEERWQAEKKKLSNIALVLSTLKDVELLPYIVVEDP